MARRQEARGGHRRGFWGGVAAGLKLALLALTGRADEGEEEPGSGK